MRPVFMRCLLPIGATIAAGAFFLVHMFLGQSPWDHRVSKIYDSDIRHDTWKDMFDDPLHPDKSDCRALFAAPASDKDFYPTSYIEHRRNFEGQLKQTYSNRHVLGNSGGSVGQSRFYYWLARRPWVKTICEIGFNAGHSTLQWLTGSDDTVVYSFDIGEYDYTRPMAGYLNKTFPGRLHLTFGNSLETVPRFTATNRNVKCDVVVVDGGHTREVGLGDLRNMQVLANMQRHVLVFDDLPSGYAKFLTALGEAWNQMRADGHIVERYACTEQPTKLKGFTVGYYV